MKKEDKSIIIEKIAQTVKEYPHFYVTETASLNAAKTSELRRKCNAEEIKLMVVKNTLLRKALETLEADFTPLYGSLKGSSTLMFSNSGNAPAKLIKDFTKGTRADKKAFPALKAAYVEECFYIGADQLENLISIKSKNELIGDLVALLQSPAKNVISALQSGGNTIHGVLQTLSER